MEGSERQKTPEDEKSSLKSVTLEGKQHKNKVPDKKQQKSSKVLES